MKERILSILWSGLKAAAALSIVAVVVYVLHFKPKPVEVVRGRIGDIVEETMGTGTLEAKTRARISSRVQGRILVMSAEQNDTVTSGQLLVELEGADRQGELKQALASVQTAVATRNRLEAELVRSRAVRDQKHRDFARLSGLHASGVISVSELEQKDEQRRVADAELARAEAALHEADRQIEEVLRRVEWQQIRLAETRIAAPFDGIVTRRNVDAGDFSVPGTTLLEIVSTQTLWVSAWVDELAVDRLRIGQPARIVFRSDPKRSYPGTVARWNREVDRETRQFLVDVMLTELPENWALGQRAEAFITTERAENAFLLPASAIRWRGAVPGVFALEQGRSRWREVELGLRGSDRVQVLRGVNEKDSVIVPSADLRLKDGKRVTDESGAS
jgi:HlyD family secretion protein